MTCTCNYCLKRTMPYTSLEDFRKAMCGLNPYSFYQWDSSKLRSVTPKRPCSPIVRQSAGAVGCDGSTVGRLDILQALLDAENIFQEWLGYDVVPTRHISTVKNYAWKAHNYPFWHANHAYDFSPKVSVPFRYVQSVGKEICTEIATVTKGTAQYAITSERSGGIFDTFTLTASGVAGVTADQISVYIDPGERTEQCEDLRRWQIPTQCVTLTTTGDLTITGGAWLLGKPELLESYVPLAAPLSEFNDFTLDPANLDCYVDKLVIVGCTIDNCQGSTAHVKQCGCATCSPDASHCETCSNVSFCIDDPFAGVLTPLFTGSALCEGLPKSFCIDYVAGNCSRDWTADISKLAVANFCKKICACGTLGCLDQWYEDLASDDYKGRTSVNLTENPLGTRRGHMVAYNQIKKFTRRTVATMAV